MAKAVQPKVKKIPVRQCLGCNEHKPKIELLRVLRSPEGEISLDFTGKKSGRGAYLCRDVKCLRRVRKSGRVETALGVAIPAEVYDDMEKELLLDAASGEDA
ncbi:MAG: YlxR family protein [Clostridia bacterium]|nr:YlxR family protein [Clostridia bacterium]